MAGIGEIDVDVEQHGALVVVAVTGEVDLVTAPSLRSVLNEVAGRAGVTCIVLDLAGVSFLDSTGIAVLTGVTKRCRTQGQDLRLCGAQAQLTRVFGLMGLDQHWQFFDTRAAATDGQ